MIENYSRREILRRCGMGFGLVGLADLLSGEQSVRAARQSGSQLAARAPHFAAKAQRVVHLFMKAGVSPERMVAIGYGEHRPVAENETPEGRSKNRRVVLVIPAEDDARRILDLQRLSSEPAEPRSAQARAPRDS